MYKQFFGNLFLAEKDWSPLLAELVRSRDLSIVLFYSLATITARSCQQFGEKEEISRIVRDQSAKFIDLVMAEVNLRVSDFTCEVPVYRQNQSLPKELLSLISRIQKQNGQNKKMETFFMVYNELLGSISRETFSASSTFTKKFVEMAQILENISETDHIDRHILIGNMLGLVKILRAKPKHFMEEGKLENFFRLVFLDLPKISKQLEISWYKIEGKINICEYIQPCLHSNIISAAHDHAENERLKHPGQLIVLSNLLKTYSQEQKDLTNNLHDYTRKFSAWLKVSKNPELYIMIFLKIYIRVGLMSSRTICRKKDDFRLTYVQ